MATRSFQLKAIVITKAAGTNEELEQEYDPGSAYAVDTHAGLIKALKNKATPHKQNFIEWALYVRVNGEADLIRDFNCLNDAFEMYEKLTGLSHEYCRKSPELNYELPTH